MPGATGEPVWPSCTGHHGTCGECRGKKSRLSLDKASTAVFWLPGMWEDENSNLKPSNVQGELRIGPWLFGAVVSLIETNQDENQMHHIRMFLKHLSRCVQMASWMGRETLHSMLVEALPPLEVIPDLRI